MKATLKPGFLEGLKTLLDQAQSVIQGGHWKEKDMEG